MRNDSLYLSRLWLAVAILLVAPALTSAQTSFVQPRITAAIDNTSRVTIPHSTHPLALPANETGRLDGTTPMQRMILVMDGSADQDYQLTVLLDSQQTQGSPDYHQWLTPDEFGQKFGPAPQDIQIVTGWLQQQGFSVDKVARSGRWVEFSGTAAQVESAFQTQMHTYQVKGEAHVANSTDISIPAALASVVRGVASLHNFFSRPAFAQGPFAQRAADGTYTPFGPGTNLTGGIHGLAPADFAKIYDVPNLLLTPAPAIVLNGTGETIAIVARSDISAQDVVDFRKVFGLPAAAPAFILDGADPGVVSGDNIEATLDTEWSGAVAPGATIDLVVSASTLISDGVDLSSAYIVDHDLAPIMSASFIGCEPAGGDPTTPGNGNFFLNSLWQQASAQGISVFVASGDAGAASCDPDGPGATGAQNGAAVSGLASTPFDTAVGGTEFNELGVGETPAPGTTEATFWGTNNPATLGSVLGYVPEMVWNDSCTPTTVGSPCDTASSPIFGAFLLAGGGGGVSVFYPTPSYQTLTVAGLQTTLNAFTLPGSSLHPRGVPDVALTASSDNDPYLLCITGSCEPTTSPTFLLIGGTSASSPSFAGIMALIDQKIGKPQGLANYVLYPLASAETYSGCNSNTRIVPTTATTCVFNDITVGNNGVPGNDVASNGGDPAANDLGFPATVGYDLASGLGSVDVNNLVTKWSTAAGAFTGSATALSPTTAINITHGATVTVTAKVTKAPTGTGPTGNVSLIAEGGNLPNNIGVAASGLTSGSATFTLDNLPGGTSYNLIASYPGDGTFAGSTSNAITVTVAREPSAVELIDALPTANQLTNSPITTTYGFPIAIEALISGVSSENSATGDGQATGTVTFTDTLGATTTNLATIALNDFKSIGVGGAEFFDCSGTQSCPAPGSHTINGSYSGDNSYLAGNSSTGMFSLAVTITSASTVTTVTAPASGTSVNQGTSVTLTATVSAESAGAAPNGTVTFFSGATQLGSPVTVTGTPGNITFFGVGTFASATASLTTTTLPVGTDSITAKYSGDTGDTNYAASPASAGITITVLSTAPAFTVTANPATVPVSAPGATGTTMLTFTATNGFSSGGAVTVTPTCTGLPSETTCSSGSMITIATNGTATATLSFQTTAPSSVFPASRNRPNIPGWRTATASALALACLLGTLVLAFGYRGKQRRWGLALVFTIFVMLAVSVGCGGGNGGGGGGGGGNPGTPAGMSSPTVSITINGVTETVPNLVLNVQ
jgi:hypothetical protein